jgi:hypothetical protein
MKCIKFVTENYNSPSTQFGIINYSEFGVPIEEPNCDPPERGQCAKGIHVIPIAEDAKFDNCIFTQKLICLEVAEEDIIYREGNGKMRCKKVIPLGDFYHHIL